MGSLLPDSSSSIGERLWRRFMPLPFSMEKTEAESVDDMMAANRMLPRIVMPRSPNSLPMTKYMKQPVRIVVMSTPRVESSRPWRHTGLISSMEVERPPVKRIMVIAKWPIDSAIP